MVESIDSLTRVLVRQHGNRKTHGRFSVVVDVTDESIYPVPKGIEHIDYVRGNFPIERMYRGEIVPSHIQLRKKKSGEQEVVGVHTGESGMEQSYGVLHSMEDLERAHTLVWVFIGRGEFRVGDVKINKINTIYLKKK